MNLEQKINREIQVFGNAVTSIYSTYNTGTDGIQAHEDLPTNLYNDPVPIAGVLSPETIQMNENMRRALTNELAGKMLISVWNIIEDTEYEDSKNQEIMFLKHIRNGVAHNNRFYIRDKGYFEYHSPAKWNGNEITISMDGELVLTTLDDSNQFMKDSEMIEGYIEAGDAKELCTDILRLVA